ncbi:MAG: hypothetical protein ONB46_05045 [candidate division KSB1 bacterium]|nr:hypothetical protein [candidate division KSB1 bacterium]MDZ7365643.1 hypothetical protein [candidate division KSB1 bacterium]MDZ7403281.1 hypothetical protein [candidate division KSB1 bacterium]
MKIDGVLNGERQPKISLVARGGAKSIRTAFVIDTGFSGDICLPVALAIELGLQLFARTLNTRIAPLKMSSLLPAGSNGMATDGMSRSC